MRSEFPRRAVHLDFHTMPGIHDFGSQFDAGEFARTLRQAHVEYVTVFAKCNLGFSYYPTKAGIVYPGLEFDLLGQMVEACHAEGVQVAAYFNAGLDHEQARRRREWCKVDRQGRVYNFEEMGHFFRNLCLNTGYRHHLLAMIREVLGRYPVDGLFLDCFSLTPCYGDECVQEMKRLGMDVFDEVQAAEYCERMTFGFLDEVRALVEQEAEGIFLYFNGMPLRRQPTHIELEVLPTGGWGYE
ncbi:MAG: alpha-L-fucosidase, partial [Candidatus Hydrogenedentes bacterium]|nr:alpha-L-fucosidase [Candidatus Hydrogenedentota bacterium]